MKEVKYTNINTVYVYIYMLNNNIVGDKLSFTVVKWLGQNW